MNYLKLFDATEKKYLAKLRIGYPNMDIPSDAVVEEALVNFKKEKVIGDLIIRCDGEILEFETV